MTAYRVIGAIIVILSACAIVAGLKMLIVPRGWDESRGKGLGFLASGVVGLGVAFQLLGL
jgi:hypothetical protein